MLLDREGNYYKIYDGNDKTGELRGEIYFPEIEEGLWELQYTKVDDYLEENGFDIDLIKCALAIARVEEKKVKVTCPIAKEFLKTEEGMSTYGDVLADGEAEKIAKVTSISSAKKGKKTDKSEKTTKAQSNTKTRKNNNKGKRK